MISSNNSTIIDPTNTNTADTSGHNRNGLIGICLSVGIVATLGLAVYLYKHFQNKRHSAVLADDIERAYAKEDVPKSSMRQVT